jgi:ubiquinone biosynthesis protein
MVNIEEFELELNDYLEAVNVISIDEVEISEVIEGLRDVLFEYKIFIPSRFHLLMRALVIIEGVGLHLDPDYQIMEEVQPYAKKLIERKYHPYTIAKKFYNSLTEVGSIAANFPTDVKAIIEKVKQGKLHIEFEHKGLDGLNQAINNLARRMAFATIVGAMIVGTALIIHSKIPPLINDIPVFGVVGFVLSAFFALALLVSLIRH